MWDSVDVLLTANPNLLLNHPTNKQIIKFNTEYNSEIQIKDTITSMKELKSKIEQL
jgi:acyl-ACP thioesterase